MLHLETRGSRDILRVSGLMGGDAHATLLELVPLLGIQRILLMLGLAGGGEETEFVLVLLGGGPGFATGFFHLRLMGAQAAHFIEFALQFHFAFQTLEGAINGFAFFDRNIEHEKSLREDVVGITGGELGRMIPRGAVRYI